MLKEYNFQIVFICANTGEQKTIEKPYKAIDFKQAIEGMQTYCMTNKSFTSVLSLRMINKYNKLSINYLKGK